MKDPFENEDWDVLLPGKTISILTKQITIDPLTVRDFKKVMAQFSILMKDPSIDLAKFYIQQNEETVFDKSKMQTLFILIMDKIPDFIPMVTGLSETTVNKLPINEILKIVTAVIEVNIGSWEDFSKNLNGLTDQITKISQAHTK